MINYEKKIIKTQTQYNSTFSFGNLTFNYSDKYLPDSFKKIKNKEIFFQSTNKRYNETVFNECIETNNIKHKFISSKYNSIYIVVNMDKLNQINENLTQTALLIRKINQDQSGKKYFLAYNSKLIKKPDLEKIICQIFSFDMD